MNNFESTGDASSTESTEREDFAKVDARLDEIKDMKMGDMSMDDLQKVIAERGALENQKAEMMGHAQEEATAEGQVREVYDEAHQENQEINEAEQKRVEAEEVAAEAIAHAEQAEQSAIKRQAELAEADALLAEIKGMGVEKKEAETKDIPQEQQTKNVESEENIMIMKYGEKMRQDADQLVDTVRQIAEKQKEINSESDTGRMQELFAERKALIEKRNLLRDDTSFFKFRPQMAGESFVQHLDYKNDEVRKYREAEKSDPYTASRLAEVKEIEMSM